MNEHMSGLGEWFAERPAWLQDAARRIIQGNGIRKTDLAQLVALCKKEAGISAADATDLTPTPISSGYLAPRRRGKKLELRSISRPVGINALAPRRPLEFGDGQLTIVYGRNGSGKSGYVRVLKHASGARKPGTLLGDVFTPGDTEPKCSFKCLVDGAQAEVEWSLSTGPAPEMMGVQVYDDTCARVYVDEENEVAFEPQLLTSFSELTALCTHVSDALDAEIRTKPSLKPAVPQEFALTKAAVLYGDVTDATTEEQLSALCSWAPEDEAELHKLNGLLAEANPAKKAREIRTVESRTKSLKEVLLNWVARLSPENCELYLRTRQTAQRDRRTADIDVKAVFSGAPLEGVGTDSWKSLWAHARSFAEQHAYIGHVFPYVGDGAKCVLCHQTLDEAARERLTSFEAYVQGALELQARDSEARLQALATELNGDSEDRLLLLIDSAGIADESSRNAVLTLARSLDSRRTALLGEAAPESLPAVDGTGILSLLDSRAHTLDSEARTFEEDAKDENRPKLEIRRRELKARKWVSEQRQSLDQEILRLAEVRKLEHAKRLTNTQQLSLKKSNLADELITQAYAKRFQDQLNALGASHIRVSLVKTRAEKGHVYHQVRLAGCAKQVDPSSVLSEGEFRMVSLAAFLADLDGQGEQAPFVFDDPITSLDQTFEEATARRLVELSTTRQVIVFTHRLSLIELIEQAAAKKEIKPHHAALRRESWGVGDPDETFEHRNPAAGLNALRQKIPTARAAFERSSADYAIIGKSLCSYFRIVLESVVERILFADVLSRFRRSVETKGKIISVAKVTTADCTLIDELVTKYSKFEHSQPLEAPVPLPNPDELGNDIERVQEWIRDFQTRSSS